MRSGAARAVWIPAHVLLVAGWLGALAAYASGSPPLAVGASAAIIMGAQALLWTGALADHPRKRAGSILSSVAGGLLLVILIGLRIYAGPSAWSG